MMSYNTPLESSAARALQLLKRVAAFLNPLLRCLGLLICLVGWNVSLAQTAAPTTITLSTSTPTFPMASGWLQITATVKGAVPTGIVTLKEGSSILDGRWLSGGVATLNVDPRVLGEHRYIAEYGGDANNAASTSAEIRVTVTKANTSVALTPSTPVVGIHIPLTLSVRVSGAMGSGAVSFMDGATLLGTVTPQYGAANLVTTFATIGTHALTATYAGDAQSHPSTSATVNLSVIQPQSTLEYDANGNLTRYTDPLGSATEHRYDSLGRLSTTYEPNPTPGATSTQGTIGYAYDALGQLKRLTDPRSLATTYTTDGLGNTTQIVSPDTGTTSFTYDEAGNLKTRTDARGLTTHFFWDVLNRPLQIDFGDARIDYCFDTTPNGVGRLGEINTVSATLGADSRLAWEYDGLGRISQRQQQIAVPGVASLVTLTQRYGWNALTDTLDSLTLPSGRVLGYRYSAAGVLTQIDLDGQPLIADIRFSAFGPLASYSAFSRVYTRRFDLNGRLTTLPLGEEQRRLAWDAASRLREQEDVPTAGATVIRRFEHDRLDRLLGLDLRSGANPAQALDQYRYTWDLAGNRSSYRYENGSGVWTYTHSTPSSSNRLDSVTGPTGKLAYSYDAAGFPKGDGARSYTWRASGWLDSLTRDGLTTRYTYNGLAQRVAKLSGSTPATAADTRLYTYDEAGHLLGEYTATGALIQEHVWLGDTPLALIDPQGVKLVFADQLDTPRRITDTNGKALWKWNGEAFGLSLPNEDADGDGKALTYNLRFPGQVFDKESNLHYNWHRYYDPATGRYISSDPIGLDGGINTFAYAGGSPIQYSDSSGLFFTSVDAACMRDPQFCAEIMGQIRKNAGDVATKLTGDQCFAEEGERQAQGWANLGVLAATVQVASGVGGLAAEAAEARAASREAKDLYHYTDEAGAKAISESGMIRANARNQVFVTDQRLSPSEVKDRLFIGRSGEKGSHVVRIQATDGLAIRQGKNANELIHQGSMRDGRHGTFTVSPNDF